MKIEKYLILFLISISFCSCFNNTVTNPDSVNKGSLSLEFNKQSIPSDVVQVIATLNRNGYDNLTRSLDILSDSTAEITFNSIPIGTWNLKVDALNSDGTVIYSGSCEIEVKEETITEVFLELSPVKERVGNIHIIVKWKIPESNWVDYQNNPVLSTTQSYWDPYGPNNCRLIFDNGVYKMWFSNLGNSAVSYIGYAISYDGDVWSRPTSSPVLSPGNPGKWDAGRVSAGPVIKENGIYKMYYLGWMDQNDKWQIGLATSQDGINWEKYPEPVLSGSGEDEFIAPGDIKKINNKYYLYYSYRAKYSDEYKTGLAFSNDGISWNKYEHNPILSRLDNWEMPGIGNPSIFQEGNKFKMVYSNSSYSTTTGFGMAESEDGINWKRVAGNPFFSINNPTINWDIHKVLTPYAMIVSNQLYIYYTGYNSNSGPYGEYMIGIVKRK